MQLPQPLALLDVALAAGEVLGIGVLDHLIVGDGRYVSFADRGWLTSPSRVARGRPDTGRGGSGHSTAR